MAKRRGRPFERGDRRINRRGRPRRVVTDLRLEARQYTELALQTLASIAASKRASSVGRVKAARELILAGWGLPPQSLSVDLPPPGSAPSIEFIFVSRKPDGTPLDDAERKPVVIGGPQREPWSN
jgi:hypothetical protein